MHLVQPAGTAPGSSDASPELHAALAKAQEQNKQVRLFVPRLQRRMLAQASETYASLSDQSCVQLEAERKELQTQVEKLRYRIDLLVASVREGDANLKVALSTDADARAALAQKLAHMCL